MSHTPEQIELQISYCIQAQHFEIAAMLRQLLAENDALAKERDQLASCVTRNGPAFAECLIQRDTARAEADRLRLSMNVQNAMLLERYDVTPNAYDKMVMGKVLYLIKQALAQPSLPTDASAGEKEPT